MAEEKREKTGKVGKGNPPKHSQFKPGNNANPNGRPRKLPALEEIIANVLGEEKGGRSAAEAILAALRAKASRGDVRAAKELLDRGYGLPKQQIQHSGTVHTTINYLKQAGNDPIPE
jgi:hypothetical protein